MEQRKKRITLFGIIVIILVILSVVAASMINAAYIKRSENVVNTFHSADSGNPDIEEVFDGTVKKDVYFKMPETEYPVYVRAMIVITWQNEDGIVYFSNPEEDTDYEIDINTGDWTLGEDGYYYYKAPVESGGQTTYLINVCQQIKPAPADGYTLSVEIIVQTIQAVGFTDGEDNMDDENTTGKIPAWQDAGWEGANWSEETTTD